MHADAAILLDCALTKNVAGATAIVRKHFGAKADLRDVRVSGTTLIVEIITANQKERTMRFPVAPLVGRS